jgi:malate dehydrogenase (oxaloacetate-decarboxylating)(NADP+)
VTDRRPTRSSERREAYAERFHELRRRRGGDARRRAQADARGRNYFGTMMVQAGDADGLISGRHQEYPETIRPALR